MKLYHSITPPSNDRPPRPWEWVLALTVLIAVVVTILLLTGVFAAGCVVTDHGAICAVSR